MAERRSFRDLPIGRKLLLLWVATMGAILICLSGLSIAQEVANWRDRTVHELTSNAKIIAANITPALLFNDRTAAADTLSALSAAPNIIFAAVYDAHGTRFSVRGVPTRGPISQAAGFAKSNYSFFSDSLSVNEPIDFKGQRVGSIFLKSDLRDLYKEIGRSAILALVVPLLFFGFATLALQRLQRGIIQPIAQLSSVMASVAASGDYAVRASKGSGDEVGVLAGAFNLMLEGIQLRDTRLDNSNIQLHEELVQRTTAQEALRAHDAMLRAVAQSAAELMGALDLDGAVAGVLELVGRTLAVGRVQLGAIETDSDGHLRSSAHYEWRAPGLAPMVDSPIFKNLDLTAATPGLAAASLLGERTALTSPEGSGTRRDLFEETGATSILFTPVMIDEKLWGGLWFIDSAPVARAWNWAETDTLGTLAALIGVSIRRSRYIQDLADADAIVQHSPTILFRLKGPPKLPLTYISRNINRLGWDADQLIAINTSFQTIIDTLVHPDDRVTVNRAMVELADNNGGPGSMPIRMALPSGEFRWFDNSFNPVRDRSGKLVEIDGSITDINERKLAEDKVAVLARTDGLTGLANRATFVERLHQTYASALRGGAAFAVIYLDLDHFKDINDTRGHPVGDILLREAAARLTSRVRDTDLVARMGGDEFAVLQTEIVGPSDAGILAAAIIVALDAPFVIEGDEMHVTVSVGISPFTPDAVGPDAMLAQADIALYRAKDEGRDQFRFHTAELDREVSKRVRVSEELRKALESNELELHYQPQVELTSGRIIGMEALVRWRHPVRGMLQPADFIPIAESTGVIRELGHWVLENACRQMRLWRDQGVAPDTVTINVSMLELKNGGAFVKDITDTLAKMGLNPGDLELDVTESMMARATFAQNNVIERLQALGVKIALDNFGGDYSSFDYVRAYKVHHLKVARQFIENATHDPERAATVRAIIGVGHDLGIQVIAEGVETEEQRKLLLSLDANTLGQGFFFSEPVEAGSATELLKQGRIAPPCDLEPGNGSPR